MNIKKILSGHELVAKGATKIEVSLPEIGYKDSLSNGSWLEQKQVQTAIEARKHLIEVQRIEKCGSLSHAEWRENLMLAEVLQKAGSYWQFFGHNKGKQLFIQPEEALFLMEVNCLHLKFNGVKVSLQQAYTLLLRGKIQILQYKVYSSLCRLGYRVYRHEKIENCHKACSRVENIIDSHKINVSNGNVLPQEQTQNHTSQESSVSKNFQNIEMDVDENQEDSTKKERISNLSQSPIASHSQTMQSYEIRKLQKLNNRTIKPCNEKNIHRFFENFPEFVNKHIVFIKAPNNNHIPKNINLKKTIYSINLQNIHAKNVRSVSMETNIYSANDEVNGSHIRRIRNSSNSSSNSWNSNSPYSSFGFANQNIQYRHFNFVRARQQYNQFNFSILIQKYLAPRLVFTPGTFQIIPSHGLMNVHNSNKNTNKSNRKRLKSTKIRHLEEIKKLACTLKKLILLGNTEEQNIKALRNLIQAYNSRYKTRIRLTNNFEIVDENILDTIELDDDGPSIKRRRSESVDNKFDHNFVMMKKLAAHLKELENNKKSSARHRRAFSKALKTFNESYNEEYYLSDKYELENRQHIDLASSDSSSPEGDLIDTEYCRSGKKLRNPFNILKRLSEKQNDLTTEASTSDSMNIIKTENKKYSALLHRCLSNGWLPPENDFGRAEVISKDVVKSESIDMKREQFLFDFLQIQTNKIKNWLDLKKFYFTSIQKAILEFKHNAPKVTKNGIESIIKPNDCMDVASTLEKLNIIRNATESTKDCSLTIDFDVFDRNIKNFKKTKRPTPNFRIVCIDEKLQNLLGENIASLQSQYKDNVTIVFAAVGLDSLVYLQINPNELPVYIPNTT